MGISWRRKEGSQNNIGWFLKARKFHESNRKKWPGY